MSVYKYKLCILVLLFVLNNKTFSQLDVFVDEEELYYDVYYSFINIGWVKFYTKKLGDTHIFKNTAILKSNDALPFVTVNFEFISEIKIENRVLYPIKFISKEFKGSKTSTLTYEYKYDSGFVDMVKIGYDNNIEYQKRLPLHTVYQDGLSIFYYARYHSYKNSSETIPILINFDSSSMLINFNTKKTEVEIDGVDYSISSLYLDGHSYFQAVFGLTGEFSGWFSNDNARIPLKSKLRVRIGNISLELKDWKRGNWKPPKF